MLISLKASLFLVAALAAAAVAAAPTSAQMEVVDETSGTHCAPTCAVNLTGSSIASAHSMGVEAVISSCTETLSGAVDEAGDGAITSGTLSGPSCTSVACSGPLPFDPWSIRFAETGPQKEHARVRLCIFGPIGNKVPCTVELKAQTEASSHHVKLTGVGLNCLGIGEIASLEFDINWEFSSWVVELVH